MKFFRKPNIFTLIIVVAMFGGLFRLVNVATFKSVPPGKIGMIMPASAEDPKQVKDEPPPISKEDLQKAVKETAKAVDSGKTDDNSKVVEGLDSIKPPSAPPPASAPVVPSPSFSASEVEVLQALSGRRDELDKREKTLAEREALLNAAAQEVDRKVSELNKLKANMESLLGQQQKAEDGRIESLVKIYENMKPKEAARIFDTLDMNILLDVIGRMNERKSSPILAAMSPEKAKDVTIKLAQQRKLPGVDKEAGTQKKSVPGANP
jgi:flagellar motility protein MotE (MotC chaperone)